MPAILAVIAGGFAATLASGSGQDPDNDRRQRWVMLNSSERNRGRRWSTLGLLLSGLGLLVALQGCYYLQAARGQIGIWNKSRPLDDVIADPATDGALAERLRLLRDARAFASQRLLLPENDSYQKYADLGRDYVLWNVIAAPQFSLQPRTWCYLLVGCLAYRGYFDQDDAERLASKLRNDGYDVYVGGVPAYSTLGRFSDPLLNTMLQRDDTDLAALLFHELAHQQLYVKDDTAFNESFASAVAEFGLREWLAERGDVASGERWQQRERLAETRMAHIEATRARLAELYSQSLPAAQMRSAKQALFAELKTLLTGNGSAGSAWDAFSLNNAWLATLSLYRGHLPAFRALFADCAADWRCFYDAVDRLAALPVEARRQSLAELVAP
ncbi:MAG: aminopeptidase [Woeseia sp.]